MAYLLDTNACIQILNSQMSPVTRRALMIPPTEIFICTVAYSELYFGAYKSQRVERNISHLEGLLHEFCDLDFDRKAAQVAGRIRAGLAAQGQTIGAYDTLIAAVAIANDLVLVTHNVREFDRVEGLSLEDWQV